MIRRLLLVYLVSLLIPSIFFMLVDLRFYLPTTCRARIVFKTSILVGYTVSRVNMSDKMPQSATSAPLIGKQPWGHWTPTLSDSCQRSAFAFQLGDGEAPETAANSTFSRSFPQGSSQSVWPSWFSAYLCPSCWSNFFTTSGTVGRSGPSCAFKRHWCWLA